MRTCKEVSVLLSQAQERELSATERLAVTVHLAICKGCAQFKKQLEFMRAAVRRWRDPDG